MLLCEDPKNSKNSVDAVVPPILPGRRSPSRFALPGLGHTCVLCRSFWVPLSRCTGGVDALLQFLFCSAHGKKNRGFHSHLELGDRRVDRSRSAALASQNNRLLNLIGPRPPPSHAIRAYTAATNEDIFSTQYAVDGAIKKACRERSRSGYL